MYKGKVSTFIENPSCFCYNENVENGKLGFWDHIEDSEERSEEICKQFSTNK
jgi:hypothetical protein